MQTYLPFVDFAWSARCLDDDTLRNQISDTYQIMTALLVGYPWVDHPASLMWYARERALLAYQQAMCNEWGPVRGNDEKGWELTRKLFLDHHPDPTSIPLIIPFWIGDPKFHISHQSALLRKNEQHYRPWFPGIRTDHILDWPVV